MKFVQSSIKTDDQEQARRDQVISRLTPCELKVLEAFADGLNRQQVANRLRKSVKTVDTQKTKIHDLCRNAWNIPQDEDINYHFLHRKFAKEKQSKTTKLLQSQLIKIDNQEQARRGQVTAHLRPCQSKVLDAFAEGLNRQQVANRLSYSLKMVDACKTVIYELCRNAWNMPPGKRLYYSFLQEKFTGFFANMEQKKTGHVSDEGITSI